MDNITYNIKGYQAWWDKGFLWFSTGHGVAVPIAREDLEKVITLLASAHNDRTIQEEDTQRYYRK